MLGEYQITILDQIPNANKPKTRFITYPYSISLIVKEIEEEFKYPLILKPDIGERGWGVSKIQNRENLVDYLTSSNVNLIAQEYLNLPLELGVFYYRLPNQDMGTVSSIVVKKNLKVTGNGESTIRELINSNPRARLQARRLESKMNGQMSQIPEEGIEIELEPIGNHCLGTMFVNGNEHITESLTRSIDQLSKKIPGFYFGRFDLRCKSFEALENGEFKVLELNGAGAEPAHIYHPGTPITEAYHQIFKHLDVLYQISYKNKESGISYMSFREGLNEWRKLQAYNKSKKTALA